MAIDQKSFSIIESIKEYWANLDLKRLSEKIGGSSAEAVQAAFYFGLFFAIGFLFKKYFKFLIFLIIGSIILIKMMEYNNLLIIDWTATKVFFGITTTGDLNTHFNTACTWVKQHILLSVSSSVGFLIGYKLG